MTNWTRSLVCVGAATALVFAGHGRAVDPPKAEAKNLTVMQRKLIHGQKVLEGLALNDFGKINTGAEDLMLCVQEASWKKLQTPKYELYSNDFIRHIEEMQTAAKNKNLDAATLAYVETTLTCIKCHQHVRDEKVGAVPTLPWQDRLANRVR
jgi:hypothetical protein